MQETETEARPYGRALVTATRVLKPLPALSRIVRAITTSPLCFVRNRQEVPAALRSGPLLSIRALFLTDALGWRAASQSVD